MTFLTATPLTYYCHSLSGFSTLCLEDPLIANDSQSESQTDVYVPPSVNASKQFTLNGPEPQPKEPHQPIRIEGSKRKKRTTSQGGYTNFGAKLLLHDVMLLLIKEKYFSAVTALEPLLSYPVGNKKRMNFCYAYAAQAYVGIGQHDKALDCLLKITEQREREKASYRIKQLFRNKNDLEAALAFFVRAHKRVPHPEFFHERARVLEEMERFKEAVIVMDIAILLSAEQPKAKYSFSKAVMLRKKGDYEAALEEIEKTMILEDPEFRKKCVAQRRKIKRLMHQQTKKKE